MVKESAMEKTQDYLYKVWLTDELVEDKPIPVIIIQKFEVLSEEPSYYIIDAYGHESDMKRSRVNSIDSRVSWCTENNIEKFINKMKQLKLDYVQDKIDHFTKRLEDVENLRVDKLY